MSYNLGMIREDFVSIVAAGVAPAVYKTIWDAYASGKATVSPTAEKIAVEVASLSNAIADALEATNAPTEDEPAVPT